MPENDGVRGFDRRQFLGSLGAAALTAVLPAGSSAREPEAFWYLDSFGNVVPASPAALAAGVMPPPLPEGVRVPGSAMSPAHAEPSALKVLTNPNILILLVDQLRAPKWFPSGSQGQSLYTAQIPNITNIAQHSFNFPNYYVAATSCIPSRAAILTGLYTPQTCMFVTPPEAYVVTQQPNLNPAFPTFGTALGKNSGSGLRAYMTGWVGRWHVSDGSPAAYPSQYGFNMTNKVGGDANLPNATFPDCPGCGNEGANGTDLVDGGPFWASANPFPLKDPSNFFSDAYVADWFTSNALPPMQSAYTSNIPWCVTVSFVNPHDISFFPMGFNLATGAAGSYYGAPATNTPPTYGFNPPSVAGTANPPKNPNYFIPPVPKVYSAATMPTGWNVSDNAVNQPYLPFGSNPSGKPNLQGLIYATYCNETFGSILTCPIGNTCGAPDYTAWLQFMNYYLWMQACVDYQIGRVLTAVINGNVGWSNTVLILTSDHGEFGGSHGLHGKGGALYEEAINVPLYVSWPTMRLGGFTLSTNTSVVNNFVCSSVDLFPFIYTLARNGDHTWRTGAAYGYLGKREDIYDAIMSIQPQYRRLSNIAVGNASNPWGYTNQPYILHTTDEYNLENSPGGGQPTHAICFRTLDPTVTPSGGAKVGIYSFWPASGGVETSYIPQTSNQQFEFYNYNTGNSAELNNDYFADTALANSYLANFQAIANTELYPVSPTILAAWKAAWAAYFNEPAPSTPPTFGTTGPV